MDLNYKILTFLVVLSSAPAYADTGCAMTSAIYKPHASFWTPEVTFMMTIEKPKGGQSTDHFWDYKVHGFKGEKEVVTDTLPYFCGSGSGGCSIGGIKEIELDQAFKLNDSKNAPYAIVLGKNTKLDDLDFAKKMNNLQKSKKKSEADIYFLTHEQIAQDYSGITLWMFDSCKK